MTEKVDQLYSGGAGILPEFEFNQDVVDVFPDMIRRSVPGYRTTISTIGLIAARFVRPGTRCYDLGCSLGAATLSMRRAIESPDVEIVAMDSSPDMAAQCQVAIDQDASPVPVSILEKDIREAVINNATVVVMNFTLQFIPAHDRNALIQKIYDGLLPGGVLVLSEKLAFSDVGVDELLVDLHHTFKRANGYSDLEISRKRDALDNVLIPETLETHRDRLKNAGFNSCQTWFQCFNFASLIAIKQV